MSEVLSFPRPSKSRSRSPQKDRRRRRGQRSCLQESRECSAPTLPTPPPEVYLVKRRARGRSAASPSLEFMRLMGLVGSATDYHATEWDCSIQDGELEVLLLESAHAYVEKLRRENENDGYILVDKIGDILGVPLDEVGQCDCLAHTKLRQTLPETESDDIKSLIRTGERLTADSGCDYALSLLRRLFVLMGMPSFKVGKSGTDFGVSYTLLCEKKTYCFRGHPDFVVHKEDIGAGRLLVATGEIQSTNNPAVPNSIYSVGSLLKNSDADAQRPILCLTIFKNKSAQLLVARLRPTDCSNGEIMGTVSLKYVVSPSPLDLRTLDGLKTLAARL